MLMKKLDLPIPILIELPRLGDPRSQAVEETLMSDLYNFDKI